MPEPPALIRIEWLFPFAIGIVILLGCTISMFRQYLRGRRFFQYSLFGLLLIVVGLGTCALGGIRLLSAWQQSALGTIVEITGVRAIQVPEDGAVKCDWDPMFIVTFREVETNRETKVAIHSVVETLYPLIDSHSWHGLVGKRCRIKFHRSANQSNFNITVNPLE